MRSCVYNLVRNLILYPFSVSLDGTLTEFAVDQFKVYLNEAAEISFLCILVCLTSPWLFSSWPRDYFLKFSNTHHVLIIAGMLLSLSWNLPESLNRNARWKNTKRSTAPRKWFLVGQFSIVKVSSVTSIRCSLKGRFTRYDLVAYDKLTTGLRYELFLVNQRYNSLTMS